MNKQRTRTLIEIGIASALGAVIGLSIAIALELPKWLWIPCGLVTFFCYRPYEVFVVAGEIGSELWQATSTAVRSARSLPSLSISINWGKVRKVMIIATQILCFAAAVWIGASYIGIVLHLTAPNPPEGVSMYVRIPFITVLFTVLTGIITCCCWAMLQCGMNDHKWRWLFPIGTRLAEFFSSGKSPAKKNDAEQEPMFPLSKGELLGFSIIFLFAPLLVHLFVVFTVVLFLMDFVVTVVLACASTERLASVAGGTLGCMAGALARVAGVNDGGGSLLIVGGLVGLITGPGLYDLRLVLGRPKHTVATTA